jgi:chorismate mutase
MKDELVALREMFADIDENLISLFARRQALAVRIGEVKAERGLAVRDQAVEAATIARNRALAARLGLAQNAAEELTRLLIAHSVRVQEGG